MKTSVKYCFAAAAALAGVPVAYGQSPQINLDGIFTGLDGYSSMEAVTFYNGHKPEESKYGTFATQSYTTKIRYGTAGLAGGTPGQQYFFVFAEVPLYAKNMVWGTSMTTDEVNQYGKRLTFRDATGSEKLIFVDSAGADKVKIDFGAAKPLGNGGQTTYGAAGLGLIAFKDSVSYLLENNISNTTSSAQHDMTMSLEMQFAVDPAKNAQLLQYARNGLNFHLSPERGLVPEPGSAALLGLFSAMFLLRRKR
jgi:hypothetical protein